MNTLAVLMGLLLLSYLGAFLTRSKAHPGFGAAGLPSSSEFLVVGVLAGPLVFHAVTKSSLESFDPIAYVAAGWLALWSGLEYGHVRGRRVSLGRTALGVVLALACGGAVAGATWLAVPWLTPLSFGDRLLLAGGAGCVCAESSRHAIEWTVQRHRAHGPVTALLRDLSHADELAPIAAVSLLFALRPPAYATIHLPPIGWVGVTFGMGLLLGALTALLLGRDLRVAESWGTLIGISLMTIGLAARLDLAALTSMFALGASIALFSRHGADVRAMVRTTERAVVLPALVLAGARIDPVSIGKLWMIVPVAIGVRLVVKLLAGQLLRVRGPAREAGALLGLGLASSGGMSVLIGLAMALRFPGPIGDTVLATAVAVSVVGEVAGPVLRRVLDRVGEIPLPTDVEQAATTGALDAADAADAADGAGAGSIDPDAPDDALQTGPEAAP
ncbi:MAG: cation:proton antiporter [Polyangiales bacterium]